MSLWLLALIIPLTDYFYLQFKYKKKKMYEAYVWLGYIPIILLLINLYITYFMYKINYYSTSNNIVLLYNSIMQYSILDYSHIG